MGDWEEKGRGTKKLFSCAVKVKMKMLV